MVDAAISTSSIEAALRELTTPRMGALVDCAIDPLTKTAHWYATDAGIQRWNINGRLVVEG